MINLLEINIQFKFLKHFHRTYNAEHSNQNHALTFDTPVIKLLVEQEQKNELRVEKRRIVSVWKSQPNKNKTNSQYSSST